MGDTKPPDDDAEEAIEWTAVAVSRAQKESFESFRRRLEAAVDRDLSQSETIAWLIDHAPDPTDTVGDDDT